MYRYLVWLWIIFFAVQAQELIPVKTVNYKSEYPEIKSPVSLKLHYMGLILIGDDFANQVFGIDMETGKLLRASNNSTGSPLSNPVSIAVDPLNIFVLDYDNQKINRYDTGLRLLSEIYLENITELPSEVNGLAIAVDFKKELYLLNEYERNIYKIDAMNRVVTSFGGVKSNILEFGYITKIENCGTDGFLTWDEEKNKLVFFDITGNAGGELLIKDRVIDFAGNPEGYWVVLIEERMILGRENRVLGETDMNIPSNGPVLVTMSPKGRTVIVLSGDTITIYKISEK